MTTLTRTPEGDYLLTGEKLWCTNGTCADLYVVMARHSDTKKISAVIVERAWEGVEVVRRCHFMGLRALENGIIRFTNVKVPKENLLLGEGKGLKLALVTRGRIDSSFKRIGEDGWTVVRLRMGNAAPEVFETLHDMLTVLVNETVGVVA